MALDRHRLGQLIEELFRITEELGAITGRKFTPDGHLVGSIGEVLAKDAFDLELHEPSRKGSDACKGNIEIEIKATFGNRVAFRQHEVDQEGNHCLVLKLSRAEPHLEKIVYNGPLKPILDSLSARSLPSNGQRQIYLTKLEALDARNPEDVRLPRERKGR